jgi:8-oxo-dGTP diphosphatase
MTADGGGGAAPGTGTPGLPGLPGSAGPAGQPGQPGLTIVVDAANVVGARPDGWWRDRAAAAARLYADLARLAERDPAGPEIILVLEGAARAAVPLIAARAAQDAEGQKGGTVRGVRVVPAPGSGDDEIAGLAQHIAGRRLIVTADRALRRRCEAAGAEVKGPAWLYARL